jgi:hypothetical protein
MTDMKPSSDRRTAMILGATNVLIWIIAIVALTILRAKGVRGAAGMFPILAGGLAVGLYQWEAIRRLAR